MLTRRIIPCLDVSGGQVVKGTKFQNIRNAGDPVERALFYQEQGADEIAFLDITATPASENTDSNTIAEVRAQLSIPLTVGGGIRSIEDARFILESGADKVAVNTAAINNPDLVDQIATQFGSQCAVVAIDAKKMSKDDAGWTVVTHGGRTPVDKDAVQWAQEVTDRGAGEILLTSWDRDGTGEGYDLDMLHEITSLISIPVIASGGASEMIHFTEALQAGADAVLAASVFHFGKFTVKEVKEYLREHQIPVRLV